MVWSLQRGIAGTLKFGSRVCDGIVERRYCRSDMKERMLNLAVDSASLPAGVRSIYK